MFINGIKYIFRRKKMEIVLFLAIAAVGVWYVFLRKPQKADPIVDNTSGVPSYAQAPYKVPEPAATTPIPLVVETAPVVEAKVEAPAAKPAKAPAKPKAAARTAKPKAEKAPAPAKAPAKAKTARKPKITVAK